MSKHLGKLLSREMTRKEFLVYGLLAVMSVFGIVGVARQLASKASTPATDIEPEEGTPSGSAATVADTGASGGQAVQFGSSSAARGPISYPDLATARANLRTPATANYVMWNNAWPATRDLEDIFALELGDNDILVLPERAQPYVIDSSEGFRAAGVASVTGRNGQLTIVNRYKNIRTARTWFAMARARRGIVGLGPGAVIEISQSSWTQEPQIEDKGSVQSDGWVSPGRYWTNTSGVVQSELVGCQEKVIESVVNDPYFGNFTMRSHSLGGVAYSGIVASKGAPVFERLNMTGAWHGFQGVPNGEAGGVCSGGTGYYTISNCVLGTRDSTGARTGTSPIMINSSTGGGLIENTDASETYAGMLTIWNSSGKHTLKNVNCRWNRGSGLNLEKCQAGMEVEWIGGSNWSDYMGQGGKPGRPSDSQALNTLHTGIYAEGGSVKLTYRGVDFDTGPTPGAVNIQSYGATKQKLADIQAFDANGNPYPIKVYGTLAG